MSGTAASSGATPRSLVLDRGADVLRLASAARLRVVGVSDRGRVVVAGPMTRVRRFAVELGALLGLPVEVLPDGVQAHASGADDLATLTTLDAAAGSGDHPAGG